MYDHCYRETKSKRKAISVRVIIIVAVLALLGAKAAVAQGRSDCQDLARLYSETPEQLSLNSLAALRTCVSSEIRSRLGGGGPGASPPTPSAAPPARPPSPVPAPSPLPEVWWRGERLPQVSPQPAPVPQPEIQRR